MSPRVSLCGVVQDGGRYLVARRNPGGSQGGKWEFPGGKQEPGESETEALVREFAEELAVAVTIGRRVFVGTFSNGGKDYRLEAWETHLHSRNFVLTEHQELRWVAGGDLLALDLSDSDRQVAEALLRGKTVEPPPGNR